MFKRQKEAYSSRECGRLSRIHRDRRMLIVRAYIPKSYGRSTCTISCDMHTVRPANNDPDPDVQNLIWSHVSTLEFQQQNFVAKISRILNALPISH